MNTSLIILDGSLGEGGGQILRTALSLSMVTGQPFHIDKIRAGREKPGLLRQHLTAVNAAATVCSAKLTGAEIGSQSLTFEPGQVSPGEYAFAVGTAGSTTLVLQTILPPLMMATRNSSITLEGGTHNPFAPPFDFLERAFVPLLNKMGAKLSVSLERAGFYPAGGGRIVASIEGGSKLSPLNLLERGMMRRGVATAVVAGLSGAIAKRELQAVRDKLSWTEEQTKIRQLPAQWGPGNALMIEIESEHVTEIFTGFGMKRLTAESVANEAAAEARKYLADGVPVGLYLADQLLVPMALAGGGSFATHPPSHHSLTNAEVIQRFLPVRISFELRAERQWLARVSAV